MWVLSLFFQEGRYLGIGIPREIHWYTHNEKRERYNPVAKGERKRKEKSDLVQAAHRYIYPLRQKERVRDTQIVRRAARPSQGQAETPTRQAETLTLEGANQDIKESGHRSRRPPAHKGYNQFIKDARRSQRAKRFSQPKQMERKIGSSAQTCRHVNREQTLYIKRHP